MSRKLADPNSWLRQVRLGVARAIGSFGDNNYIVFHIKSLNCLAFTVHESEMCVNRTRLDGKEESVLRAAAVLIRGTSQLPNHLKGAIAIESNLES